MNNIINVGRVIQAGNCCELYFCCIHSTKYVDGHSIMDATILDTEGHHGVPLHPPERATIVRKDPDWRADMLADTIAEFDGFHNVLLHPNGQLDDCGGLAGPCPCGKEKGL